MIVVESPTETTDAASTARRVIVMRVLPIRSVGAPEPPCDLVGAVGPCSPIPEPRRPLPDAAGHRAWQTVPKLTRDQNKLAAMVAFVGNEIRQDVPNVQRHAPPHVAS